MKRFLCWLLGHKWKSIGHEITQWGEPRVFIKCLRCKESKTVEE